HAYDMSPESLALAEPLGGPLTRQVSQWAQQYGMTILAGFLERHGDALHNSQVVALPDGTLGVERKHHLTPGEIAAGLTPGKRERTIFDINGVRCAVLICADSGIEGIYDDLAQQGVEFRFHPTAGGGKLEDYLHESDLQTPEGQAKYTENRPRVFLTQAILSEDDCKVCGFAAANALGDDGKSACHQGHCSIVDNNRVMRAQIPGTIVLEHHCDQMAHAVISFA
ncbi:MAG TPA: carbon-nitrogen hydrolase family protein, partial [Armatimonadota bacterium]